MDLPWHRRWLAFTQTDLDTEERQCREEGREMGELDSEFERLRDLDAETPEWQRAMEALLDRAQRTPIVAEYPYREPSELDAIQAERPTIPSTRPVVPAARLGPAIHAAWTGRAAGCLLGKPVEGWKRAKIEEFLRSQDRFPLHDYFRRGADAGLQTRFELAEDAHFLEDVADGTPEDDDLNYTLCALLLLEEHGLDFTAEEVARLWMDRLPVLHTCTAERVAYKNFCLGLFPPASGSHRNPYREWIGAQIRGDLFGYVAAGDPETAAALAHRDGSVSHVKNGIYGEMWVAAATARAFLGGDPRTWIDAGLAQIPAHCRMADALTAALDRFDAGHGYDADVDWLHTRYDEHSAHDWCAAIPNVVVVALALLHGQGEFGRTITHAVQPGFDTDCNGATAGSMVAAALGDVGRLGSAWTEPLRGVIHSGLAGFHRVQIADVARRTHALAEGFAGQTRGNR